MSDACKTCRFYVAPGEYAFDKFRGNCVRYPPVVFTATRHTPATSADRERFWSVNGTDLPAVTEDFWCGEWKEKTA